MPSDGAVIEARNVFKVFVARGDRHRQRAFLALRDVNLLIEPGQFISFVGPSGCGKSTLLNMVAGLVRPTEGVVRYKGMPISDVNTDVGYITQDDNLLPWRTLRENVEVALEFRGVPANRRRKQAEKYIAMVGLSGFEHHYPHELSGGMRKRTALVRTLISSPRMPFMFPTVLRSEDRTGRGTGPAPITSRKAKLSESGRRPPAVDWISSTLTL